MHGSMLACALLLLLAASCQGLSPVTISSLKPDKLTVNLTFNIQGSVQSYPVCMSQAPGSSCLPDPHAARDSVLINYGVMPQFTANSSDTVLIKACYSPFSRVNRPWRNFNDLIAKSKACPFIIKNGLSPSGGNVTWKIPNTVPVATYFIRALVYQKNPSDPANPDAVAIGDSKGFFQVKPISTREKGLVAAAGVCICVGPILFTIFMLWEFKIKKV